MERPAFKCSCRGSIESSIFGAGCIYTHLHFGPPRMGQMGRMGRLHECNGGVGESARTELGAKERTHKPMMHIAPFAHCAACSHCAKWSMRLSCIGLSCCCCCSSSSSSCCCSLLFWRLILRLERQARETDLSAFFLRQTKTRAAFVYHRTNQQYSYSAGSSFRTARQVSAFEVCCLYVRSLS